MCTHVGICMCVCAHEHVQMCMHACVFKNIFFIFVYFILCIIVFCLHACLVHAWQLQSSEEGPGTGVVDGCELLCG